MILQNGVYADVRQSRCLQSHSRYAFPLRYTAPFMAKTKVRRESADIREHPSYSIPEAADYLGIPASTLKTWVRGYRRRGKWHPPMIRPADPRNGLLSFYNLVEAHILDAARRRNIPTRRLRIAVEWAYETLPGPHPLVTNDFALAGRRIFVEKLQGKTVEASRFGQIVSKNMAPLLKKFLKTIMRDPDDDTPIEINTIRKTSTRVSPLSINPKICSGRPVVKGTDVLASILRHRASAGEPLSDLAIDYGLDEREIKKVVRYLGKAA